MSKNGNFDGQIFRRNGKTKARNYVKSEYNLESKLKYCWIQLTDALPKLWKDRILNCIGNSMNLCIFDHHLIKKNNLYCLNKLGSRELYQIQISEKYKKATSQLYYEGYFNNFDFDWKPIYLLLHMVTVNTKLKVFQYKILNNILFMNKWSLNSGKLNRHCVLSAKLKMKLTYISFYRCRKTSILWRQLREFFSTAINLPSILPQSVISSFLEYKLPLNHILLII